MVNLFRDFWLIVALFRLCDPGMPYMNQWKSAGLARIAAKTPVFVTEEAQDYLSSNLEYNRVLRKDYIEHVSEKIFSFQKHFASFFFCIPRPFKTTVLPLQDA